MYPEHLTEELDYELELAVILRKPGKWFGPEEAMDNVGGYVIFNDITARDIQRREMQSGVFSSARRSTRSARSALIVTPATIPTRTTGDDLRVNGSTGASHTPSRMSVTIPEILSHYSALATAQATSSPPERWRAWPGSAPTPPSLYLLSPATDGGEIERIARPNPVILLGGHGGRRRPAFAAVSWQRATKLDRVRALMATRPRRPRRPRS